MKPVLVGVGKSIKSAVSANKANKTLHRTDKPVGEVKRYATNLKRNPGTQY